MLIELWVPIIATGGLTLAVMFLWFWLQDRRFERRLRLEQLEREDRRAQADAEERKRQYEEAKADADYQRYVREQKEDEAAVRQSAGGGSGGYIVIDLPDHRRALFHDLLKGFEEYAQLRGYRVSFSIDSTFAGRVAFKFTLTDSGVVVGAERVRKDFADYLERIRGGAELDDLPVVASIAEHEALVATLKNRISFLQHSYNLARNAVDFYETLVRKARQMPVLPAQSIVVQTGGALNSPTYSAVNSPRALLGEGSTGDQSIRLAVSFNDKRQQLDGIERLLELLRREPDSGERGEAIRSLENVKEEIAEQSAPDSGRVARWLDKVRQALQLGSLGYETTEAAKTLFRLFGWTA